jgi:hypothetical protein
MEQLELQVVNIGRCSTSWRYGRVRRDVKTLTGKIGL